MTKYKHNFKIEIYADGADYKNFIELNKLSYIKGFTTNPSLLKKSGVKNYKLFAKDLLKVIERHNNPIPKWLNSIAIFFSYWLFFMELIKDNITSSRI